MKKKLQLSILIIALMAIAVTGCKKFEEVYSCDSATNEWVKSNLKTIQKMNRQDLLQLESEKQMPAFRAFTPEQRYNCLVDKLEQVKSLEWTEKEIAHICLLAETMKLEWFEDSFKKTNFEEMANFLNQWVNDGISYFGWTTDELGRMVACLKDVEMKDQYVVLKAVPPTKEPPGTTTTKPAATLQACHCSKTSDWCASGEKCSSSDCIPRGWGCGTILIFECDGRCKRGLSL